MLKTETCHRYSAALWLHIQYNYGEICIFLKVSIGFPFSHNFFLLPTALAISSTFIYLFLQGKRTESFPSVPSKNKIQKDLKRKGKLPLLLVGIGDWIWLACSIGDWIWLACSHHKSLDELQWYIHKKLGLFILANREDRMSMNTFQD